MRRTSTFARRIQFCLAAVVLGSPVLYIVFQVSFARVVSVLILNKTGARIRVDSDKSFVILGADECGEIKYPATTLVFFVQSAGTPRKEYGWVAPGDWKRYRRHGHVSLQIEADFNIYILPGAPTSIAEDLPEQPLGYPLLPKT